MLYAFGIFEFDTETGELRRSGRSVALEPQPARALALLVSRAGDVVLREQLAAHVWGSGTHVDFNRGLAYCVSEIRRALGDSADNPRFVQTLPKRGFRFIAPVQSTAGPSIATVGTPPGSDLASTSATPVASESESSLSLTPEPSQLRWRHAAVAASIGFVLAIGIWALGGRGTPSRPVIAVSVFDNETGESRYDLPVRALSDAVVDRLTKLGPDRIGVVGNLAALRMPRNERDLKKIAEETGAGFVILAQFQRTGQDWLLLIHLIRLDDGTHVWTHRIPRPAEDPLAGLDEEAARSVEAAARRFVLGDR
jgi:DNA-binding winged helix-turn-helix (wHTH) protein/TolB-like protein